MFVQTTENNSQNNHSLWKASNQAVSLVDEMSYWELDSRRQNDMGQHLNGNTADLRDPTCSDESFRRSLKTFLFAKY